MAFTTLPALLDDADISPSNWTLWIKDNFALFPSSLALAKGDMFPGTGNHALGRLAAGTDGQVIESDSSQSLGMKNSWAFIPIGGIIMWSGTAGAWPSNWQLCDGTNGTANLRDRFIVGAGSTYSVGNSGGAATLNLQHSHTLTTSTSANASHTHTQAATGAGTQHRHNNTTGGPSATNGVNVGGAWTASSSSHTHTFTTDYESTHTHTNPDTASGGGTHTHTVTSNSQLSAAQDILPPYYALAFIQRMS